MCLFRNNLIRYKQKSLPLEREGVFRSLLVKGRVKMGRSIKKANCNLEMSINRYKIHMNIKVVPF